MKLYEATILNANGDYWIHPDFDSTEGLSLTDWLINTKKEYSVNMHPECEKIVSLIPNPHQFNYGDITIYRLTKPNHEDIDVILWYEDTKW